MTWSIGMEFKKCRYVVVNDGESRQKVWSIFTRHKGCKTPDVWERFDVWAGCSEEFEYLGEVKKCYEGWHALYTNAAVFDVFRTRKEAENELLLYWYNRPGI